MKALLFFKLRRCTQKGRLKPFRFSPEQSNLVLPNRPLDERCNRPTREGSNFYYMFYPAGLDSLLARRGWCTAELTTLRTVGLHKCEA